MKKDFKDYFIPSKENNYAPHSFQKAAMLGMVLLIALSFTVANVQSLLWISSQWMISTILPSVIVDLTNDVRADESLQTLKRNALLDEAARLKAEDMAKNQYFAHYSPDGVSPWHWFGEVSYNFVHAGENLAIHFTDSEEVVDAWMESPSHRANIVNGNYAEIGVGTAEGEYEGYHTIYVVQLFGTQAAPIAVATPAALQNENSAETVDNEQDVEVLAESVSITEDVEVIEAEPVAVVTEEEIIPEPVEVTQAEESTTTASTSEIVSADLEVTEQGFALYSDFMSTSTGGAAASATAGSTERLDGEQVPFFLELATQPHKMLQIFYILISFFVLLALLISIIIEVRHQQPLQIAYGIGLLVLMTGLFYVHTVISGGALIV